MEKYAKIPPAVNQIEVSPLTSLGQIRQVLMASYTLGARYVARHIPFASLCLASCASRLVPCPIPSTFHLCSLHMTLQSSSPDISLPLTPESSSFTPLSPLSDPCPSSVATLPFSPSALPHLGTRFYSPPSFIYAQSHVRLFRAASCPTLCSLLRTRCPPNPYPALDLSNHSPLTRPTINANPVVP
jgi:hypothetical protein